jgi:hypothetical protein
VIKGKSTEYVENGNSINTNAPHKTIGGKGTLNPKKIVVNHDAECGQTPQII